MILHITNDEAEWIRFVVSQRMEFDISSRVCSKIDRAIERGGSFVDDNDDSPEMPI